MYLTNLLVFASSALSNYISRSPSLTNLNSKFSICYNLYQKFSSLSVKTNTSRHRGNHVIKVGMSDIGEIPTISLKTRDISIFYGIFFPSLQILGIYTYYFMLHDVVLTSKMTGIFLCMIELVSQYLCMLLTHLSRIIRYRYYTTWPCWRWTNTTKNHCARWHQCSHRTGLPNTL